jgi:hypothetical protein
MTDLSSSPVHREKPRGSGEDSEKLLSSFLITMTDLSVAVADLLSFQPFIDAMMDKFSHAVANLQHISKQFGAHNETANANNDVIPRLKPSFNSMALDATPQVSLAQAGPGVPMLCWNWPDTPR